MLNPQPKARGLCNYLNFAKPSRHLRMAFCCPPFVRHTGNARLDTCDFQ